MNTWQYFWGWRRSRHILMAGLLTLSLLAGCAAPSQNPSLYTGAGLGAALGAGLGAAINHRNPWKGAAIGGLLGAAGGGIAGEAYGRSTCYPCPQQTQGYYQQAPQPYYGPPPG